MVSPKRLARIAGLLYLIVGIFGGLAIGYATPKVYVAGEPARTAENIMARQCATIQTRPQPSILLARSTRPIPQAVAARSPGRSFPP